MAWISLVLAGVMEMLAVAAMGKFSKERSPSSLLLLIAGFAASFLLLSHAMKTLPMGVTYAVWTGIGASGGAVLGMMLYGESRDWRRIVCLSMIILAAIGLKLVS